MGRELQRFTTDTAESQMAVWEKKSFQLHSNTRHDTTQHLLNLTTLKWPLKRNLKLF